MDTDLTNLAADEGIADVPRDAIAPRSTSASAAYRLIHDELMLDGNARLNLATFVTTWMEPEARAPDRPSASTRTSSTRTSTRRRRSSSGAA